MASRAGIRDSTTRAMTGSASLFGWQNNIGGHLTFFRLVALRTGEAGVFGVIELSMRQPPIHHERLRNVGFAAVIGLHLVTIRASRVQRVHRAANSPHLRFRPAGCGAEEHALLKI